MWSTHLSLEELTGGLFAGFSWNWTLPVNLSHQVIKDLRGRRQKPANHRAALGYVCVCVCVVTSLTLILLFAEVSRKAQEFHWRASPMPDSLATTRSTSRSHLFPTRIMGTCAVTGGNGTHNHRRSPGRRQNIWPSGAVPAADQQGSPNISLTHQLGAAQMFQMWLIMFVVPDRWDSLSVYFLFL